MVNIELLYEKINSLEIENDELKKELKYTNGELLESDNALEFLKDKLEKEQNKKETHCWFCREGKMIWGSDFSFEDFGIDGEGIVAILTCPNCDAQAEFYLDLGEPKC